MSPSYIYLQVVLFDAFTLPHVVLSLNDNNYVFNALLLSDISHLNIFHGVI